MLHFVSPAARWRSAYWWLFLPFVIQLVIEVILWLHYGPSMESGDLPWIDKLMVLENAVFHLYCLVVWSKSMNLLRRHRRDVRRVRADAELADLRWLRGILVAAGVLIVASTVQSSFDYVSLAVWTDGLLLVSIVMMGIFAIGQEEVYPYSNDDLREVERIVHPPEAPPADIAESKTGKVDTYHTDLRIRLNQVMEKERPYLDPRLSLPALAALLDVRPQLLSEIINERPDQNFYQYITGYRIEEAKRLLCDPTRDYLTMVGLAEEAGFNSKTTFNTRFKEATGFSPSAYRKKSRNIA